MSKAVAIACVWILFAGHAYAQSSTSDDADTPAETDTAAETTEPSDDASAESKSTEDSSEAVAEAREPESDNSEDELICRRMQVTGTHRRVRRCFTRAELEEQGRDARRIMRGRLGGAPQKAINNRDSIVALAIQDRNSVCAYRSGRRHLLK